MRSGSCPRQQMRAVEPPSSKGGALSTFLPIIVALILLPAIAFASSPDPSWIAGLYDGADGDDIVSLVYETAAAHAAQGSHIAAFLRLAELPPENIACAIPGDYFTRSPRAPPVPGSAVLAHVFSSHCTFTPSGTDLQSPAHCSPRSVCPAGTSLDFFTSTLGSDTHLTKERDHDHTSLLPRA